MSNPSLFPDPNQEKKLFGDANLLKFHTSNDTAEDANKEKTDHKSGNFNPLRKSFEEKRSTANDTTENANKERNDHKQVKHDHWRNLLEESRETTSQTSRDGNKRKQNDTRIPDDLNSHISKDDTGVQPSKNNPNSDVTTKLTIEQRRKSEKDIITFTENERLNQLNKKIANDRLRNKGIDPKEFNDTQNNLYKLEEARQKGKDISEEQYKIELKKYISMLKKLGHTTNR